MVLLERESYLAGLDAALAEAQAGTGRIALISGEAGIGKTSLVEHFTNIHRHNVPVLWGKCDALFSPRPLGPLFDMAAQLREQIPELLYQNANHSAIFGAVLNELQRQTAIVVFEDVHWADEATFDLIRYLGRRINQTRSLLVLTFRDDELGALHPLRTLLGDLVSSNATRRIPLSPLSEKAVRALIPNDHIEAAALHRQTGGNPFFVTEVLASPGSSIPATIRDAVLARAARLTSPGYAVLECAAVIGPRIEPWLLIAAAFENAVSIDECIAGGMLVVQGNLLAFRHELARQVIYESTSPARRRNLHRTILDLLSTSPLTHGDMARQAYHADAAGDGQSVLEYAPAAARRASEGNVHREAAALYEMALPYASVLPLQEHARMLQLYAQECNSIDNRVLGIEVLRKALGFWLELGFTLDQGAVLAQIASMLSGLGKDGEAIQYSGEAIALLEMHPPGQELASAYRVQASLDMAQRNLTEAVSWAEKSIQLAEKLGNQAEYFAAQVMLGSTKLYLNYQTGCQHLEQILARAHEADMKLIVVLAYANLGSISSELHYFRRAENYLKEGLAYIVKHDLDRLRFYMLAWLAYTLLNLGLWNEAAEAAGVVIKDALRSVTSRLTALVTLGRLRARRGDPQANILLDEALELSKHMGGIDRLGLLRVARAEAAWLRGDHQKTLDEVRAVYDTAINKRHSWYAGELAFWRWQAGDKVTTSDWMAQPFVLQINGNWKAAAAEWGRLGCPYEQAFALADGDLASQITALEVFERIGAYPAAEKLRKMLQKADVPNLPPRPRVTTRENPFGLTSRQVEILNLLIEGLTNAEIANRLTITLKTADHHVSAILEKLDVHSRDSAAALARKHPYFKKSFE
jgi:DNA-binding CsgD family transcriptional regulator